MSFITGDIKVCTIAQLRALDDLTLKQYKTFYCDEAGKEGFWEYDPNDSSSVDNLGTILVTGTGKRLKRVYDNEVNITWFGAIGDGLTDCSSSIQGAINAGLNIFIPKPSQFYLVTSKILISSYQTFRGDTYLSQNSTDNITIKSTSSDYVFEINNGIGVGSGVCVNFKNISFSGNNTNIFIKNAIQRLNVVNCNFKFFSIVFENTAYSNSDVVENVIKDNYFISCGKVISSTFSTTKRVTDAYFENNFIVQCNYGLDVDGGAGWSIGRNHFYGSTMTNAIKISGFAIHIIDNYLEPSTNTGITYIYNQSSGFAKTKISDNIILLSSSGSIGITLQSLNVICDNIDVTNNTIDSQSGVISSSIGINVSGSYNILGTFKYNTITSNISTDINVQAGLSIPRQIYLRSQDSNGGSLRLQNVNGITFYNNTRYLEAFGKPTFSGLGFGSFSNVYNQSTGSVLDIGLWGFVSGGWKQYVNLTKRMIDVASIPTSGSDYSIGDIVLNRTPTIVNNGILSYTQLGWRRLTSGSSHTLGTDWAELNVLYNVPTIITSSSNLDFGAISGNSYQDLNISLTGASLGDVVSIGVPYSSSLNCMFTSFVSASNLVAVRCYNLSSGSTDPVSGTFKVTIIK